MKYRTKKKKSVAGLALVFISGFGLGMFFLMWLISQAELLLLNIQINLIDYLGLFGLLILGGIGWDIAMGEKKNEIRKD